MKSNVPLKILLTAFVLLSVSDAFATEKCTPLPHAQHRIQRFVKNPKFAPPQNENRKDLQLESIPVFVLQSTLEETSRPIVYSVEVQDAFAKKELRAESARAKGSQHEKSKYQEKFQKPDDGYETLVDKMRRGVELRADDYSKLEGLEVTPTGDLCMVATDLILDDSNAAAVPTNPVAPAVEKAATK